MIFNTFFTKGDIFALIASLVFLSLNKAASAASVYGIVCLISVVFFDASVVAFFDISVVTCLDPVIIGFNIFDEFVTLLIKEFPFIFISPKSNKTNYFLCSNKVNI